MLPSLAQTLLVPLLLLCNFELFQADISYHSFAADIYDVIATKQSTKNLVFSPIAIQIGLASIFEYAEGDTAKELRIGSSLGDEQQDMYQRFYEISEYFGNDYTAPQTIIYANRIFHHRSIFPIPRNNDIHTLPLEDIDFRNAKDAVKHINNYIAQQTENHIRGIVRTKDIITNQPSAVLVSGIYLKAEWKLPFDPRHTRQRVFYKERYSVDFVETVIQVGSFRSGLVPELRARAVELDFKYSNLSMLILIPNNRGEIMYIIDKLINLDLREVVAELTYAKTLLRLPKFKIKSNIDLRDPLKKLDIKNIFDPKKAELKELFKDDSFFATIKHSAFLDINEYGALTEPFPVEEKNENIYNLRYFFVDRPFVYIIRSDKAIYFAGHVVSPQTVTR